MGLLFSSISTIVNDDIENVTNETYNKCNTGSDVSVQNIDGFNFKAPSYCGKDSSVTFGQVTSLDTTCVINNLQASTAKMLSKMDNKATAGIGFDVTTSVSKTTENLKNYVNNKCGPKDIVNYQNLKNIYLSACKANIIQTGDAKESCVISNTQDILSKVQKNAKDDSQGGSVIGDLFGSGGNFAIFMIILLIIAVIGGIGYYYYADKKMVGGSNSNFIKSIENMTFGEDIVDNIKKNPAFILCAIILIVFLILIFYKHFESEPTNLKNNTGNTHPKRQNSDGPIEYIPDNEILSGYNTNRDKYYLLNYETDSDNNGLDQYYASPLN